MAEWRVTVWFRVTPNRLGYEHVNLEQSLWDLREFLIAESGGYERDGDVVRAWVRAGGDTETAARASGLQRLDRTLESAAFSPAKFEWDGITIEPM